MSHDTHQHTEAKGPKTPLGSAFWFVLVLVLLFIAAVNFVNVMSHDEGEGHGAAQHEAVEGGHGHEAAAAHEEHATEAAPAEHAADTTVQATEEHAHH
jgi:hypothetical protein